MMTNTGQGAASVNDRSSRPSRRGFLSLGLSAAGAFAGAVKAAKAADTPQDVDPGAVIGKLVRRTTMGWTPEEEAFAASMGYEGYLDHQLHPERIEDSFLDNWLAQFPRLNMTFPQLYEEWQEYYVKKDLSTVTMLRAVFSRRQLFERMAEFWNDHFNIDMNSAFGGYFRIVHEREVVRPHVLGNFYDLLLAQCTSPAMMVYLTNTMNISSHPTENFPRELMELHTMGANTGYTQQDVEEVSRCFTGWSIVPWYLPDTGGSFFFDAAHHDNDEKIVMGNVIPAGGGVEDGMRVIRILADHPATAQNVCRKLCNWLLQEQPPADAVDRAVGVFRSSNGNIREVIRTILRPNELAAAKPKLKRPFHLVASGARVLRSEFDDPSNLREAIRQCGHPVFEWGPPNGYPDAAQHWGGNLMPRWNYCTELAENRLLDTQTDVTTLFTGMTGAEEMTDQMDKMIFGGEMPAVDWVEVRDFLAVEPQYAARRRAAVGLALCCQGFQWY